MFEIRVGKPVQRLTPWMHTVISPVPYLGIVVKRRVISFKLVFLW